MSKISEPITLEKLLPLIQQLSQVERENLRKLLDTDAELWQEKWEDISAHFHEAFANTPEDEVIRDFDEALAEVRREGNRNQTEAGMEFGDIFEFIGPNAIRIKGTRLDIEVVIEEFLYGANPRRIRRSQPNLTLLQIYGSIVYYLLNRERMDAYIEAGRAVSRAVLEKYSRNTPRPTAVSSHYLKSTTDGSEDAVVRETAPAMVGDSAEASARTETGNLNLRDIFEFISPEAIRIKGTRINIEFVIKEFLDGCNPEEIRLYYPSLEPLHVYGSITYYLLNRERMDAYIEAGRKAHEAEYREQQRNPSPGVARLMKISAEAKNARLQFRGKLDTF